MNIYRVGDHPRKILTNLKSEELPVYPFLGVPDILEAFKNRNYQIRSRTYPCGMSCYALIVVREFDSEQRGEIDTYTLLSHMIDAGEY